MCAAGLFTEGTRVHIETATTFAAGSERQFRSNPRHTTDANTIDTLAPREPAEG